MSSLRILQIRSSSEVLGAERVVIELCNNLSDKGCVSILGVPTDPRGGGSELITAAKSDKISVAEFPISGPFDLSVLSRFRQYVRENTIDIVHSHGYRENLYALACRSDAKIVATNHLWKRTSPRLRLYAYLDAKLLRRFPKIVAVSSEIAEDVRESGINSSKIEVVSNGIATDSFIQSNDDSIRKELGIEADRIVYGTVSSLTPEKAVANAVMAIKDSHRECPNACLLIVGDGPERNSLEHLANASGIKDRIFFAGRRSNMSAVYGAIDVFVLPSLIEGLPMALLEAMSSALPVIATDVGDVRTVVDSEVGNLVRPGDVEALSSSIRSFARDDQRRVQMGLNARRRIVNEFSSTAMTGKYLEIYRQLLAGG